VRIEPESVAECLNSNNRAGEGFLFGYGLLHENFQGVPGTAADTGKKLSII
jgi:hypothetical protein